MKLINFKSARMVFLGTTLILTACNSGGGGGGGGGGGFQQPSIPDSLVGFSSIDPQEAALTADFSADLSAEFSTPMVFGVQSTSTPEYEVMIREVMDKTLKQSLSAISTGSAQQYVTAFDAQLRDDCVNYGGWGDTGEIIFSVHVANQNTLDDTHPDYFKFSANDYVTMDISGCSESTGGNYTGSVKYTFNTDFNAAWLDEFADHSSCTTTTSCDISSTVVFNNFGGGDSTFSLVIHGDITSSLYFDTTSTEYGALDMTSFWIVLNVDGMEYGVNLRDLHLESSVDLGGNYTLDGQFSLGATNLSGYIDVVVTNVSGIEGDLFASSGTIEIFGANNHSITTTYGVNTITIDVDNDGNLGTDFSLTGTWSEFDAGTLS